MLMMSLDLNLKLAVKHIHATGFTSPVRTRQAHYGTAQMKAGILSRGLSCEKYSHKWIELKSFLP
jgi:hypothetical protein